MTTIDTSTEAVERLLDGVTPGPWAVDEGERYCDVVTDYGAFGEDFVICEHAHQNARFIAAARDLVPALLKERDDLRAKLAVAAEALREIAATEVFSMGIGIDPRPTNEAKIARATLTKIKGADHE